MSIIGRTEDGKMVHDGLFKFYDTYGLPFEDIFYRIKSDGGVPAWPSLYADARAAGWKHARIIARLSESIGEVWGPEFRDVVIARLEENEA